MLQNFNVGNKSHRWWDWSHCGTKCYKMSMSICGEKFHRSLALFIGAGAARLALPPQQPRYLGKFAETAETPAISLELPILATTLWAAEPTRFPSAAAIPAHSTIQCPPLRHPTSPSAHPARAGVCSESPYPAERTNKKTAGSHETGSLDGHPPLLRQQVSSRAPPSLSASSSARLLARSHGQYPTGTSLHSPPTSLTTSRSS
jgi:hypothetical protein